LVEILLDLVRRLKLADVCVRPGETYAIRCRNVLTNLGGGGVRQDLVVITFPEFLGKVLDFGHVECAVECILAAGNCRTLDDDHARDQPESLVPLWIGKRLCGLHELQEVPSTVGMLPLKGDSLIGGIRRYQHPEISGEICQFL
jgi:hypothetical protein